MPPCPLPPAHIKCINSDNFGVGYFSSTGSHTCDKCTYGYYRSSSECIECTDNMLCEHRGTNLETVPVPKFYYRFSAESNAVYSCDDYKYKANCVGAEYTCEAAFDAYWNENYDDYYFYYYGSTAESSFMHNCSKYTDMVTDWDTTTWRDTLCSKHSTGPLCAVCRGGSYFDTDEEQCVDCGKHTLPMQSVLAICFFVILLTCGVGYTFFRRQIGAFADEAIENATHGDVDVQALAESKVREQVDIVESQVQEKLQKVGGQIEDAVEANMTDMQKAWRRKLKDRHERLKKLCIKLAPKLNIIITFTQLVGGLGFVLAVSFPEPYTSFVDGLNSITEVLSLNVFSMAPFECYYYGTNLVFSTMYPIALSVILISLHARDQNRKREGSPWFSIFLALTYLILPSTALKIFYSFKWDSFCEGTVNIEDGAIKNDGICDGIEDLEGHRSFLAVDYRFEWESSEATVLVVYATIMVFIYAIGIPLLYIVLLWRSQAELSLHKPIKLDPAKLPSSRRK